MNYGSKDAMRGHLAMLGFSALVAGSFSLGGLMANDISPVALMAARFALAAVIIGVAVQLTGGLKRTDFAAPWRYLLLGGVFAIYFVLMFEGLKTAPPVSTAAVFTLMPMMTAGFGYLVLRQITTMRIAAALIIGASGALWVIFRADVAALMAFDVGKGEVTYFIGCIAHALYIPMLRKLNRGENALVVTLGVLVAGAIVLTAYGWQDIRETPWRTLPGIVWVALSYLVVFATAMTFVLLQYASMRLPAAKVIAYSYLTPSWVICWEVALGHGAPNGLVLGGVALTLIAVGLLLKDDG